MNPLDGAIEEEVSKERPAEVILLGLLEAAVELREKVAILTIGQCFAPPISSLSLLRMSV